MVRTSSESLGTERVLNMALHIYIHDASNTPGKPTDYQSWAREVMKKHPKARMDGNFAYVGAKIVAEWRGTVKSSFIAEPR